jgi:hypothetical protein
MHATLRRAAFALPFLAAIGCLPPAAAQLKAPATPPPAVAGPSAQAGAPAANQNGGPPPGDPLSREFRECVQKAQAAMQAKKADDPSAIHACLTAEIKRQESKLTVALQKLAKILPPERKKRLDATTSDWRQFRSSECGFVADESGPPPANLENADCRLRMTTMRAMEMTSAAAMFTRQDAALKAQQEPAQAAAPAAPAAPPPPADAKK